MPKHTLVDIEFCLEWKSNATVHTDIFQVQKVDVNYDELPNNLGDKISALSVGESCSDNIQAKDLLDDEHSSSKVISFDAALFNQQFKNQSSPPTLFRFYPSAIAFEGLDTTESDYTPFRLISHKQDTMIGDINHPLAKYYLTLTAKKIKQSKHDKHSYPKRNIAKLITAKGPGMQAPFEFGDCVFFNKYPYKSAEPEMASKPKLDSQANIEIAKLYAEQLPALSKILDLMSDDNSFLDTKFKTGMLTGIGINEEPMSKNKRLDTYATQNLNIDTILPFESDSFDDAVCTLSIEKLTNPLEIMKEVARVVKSNGKFIITFSSSWQPTQAIDLWGQLHPFERIQLVLEYFRESGLFSDLNTFSKRGVMKSEADLKTSKKPQSSPIFAVWGTII